MKQGINNNLYRIISHQQHNMLDPMSSSPDPNVFIIVYFIVKFVTVECFFTISFIFEK